MNSASLRKKAAALGVALLVAACGGGGGDDGPRVVPPTAQVAAPSLPAGPDGKPAAAIGQAVTFTATGTSPRAGATLSYLWTLSAKPAGSQATLTGSGANATLVPDLPGRYQVSVTVNDGQSQSSAVHVEIEAISLQPVAAAGDNFVTLVAAANVAAPNVQLDGSKSAPPTGGDPAKLRYQWELIAPAGSTATLDDPTDAYPRFRADVEGIYRARLNVHYEDRASASPAEVTVTAQRANVPATISVKINGQDMPASGAFTVERGKPLVLDASDTIDPDTPNDKSKLQFRWLYTAAIPHGVPTLTDARQATLTLTPQAVNRYLVIRVQVFDGSSVSSKDIPLNIVKPAGEAPLAPVLYAPLLPYGTQTDEAEAGAPFRLTNSDRAAYNPDSGNVVYKWNWVNTPSGWDANNPAHFDPTWSQWGTPDPRARSARFTPLTITQAGVTQPYTVELQICREDLPELCSQKLTQTYTARLGANRAPTASAKVSTANTIVGVGTRVTLDGGDSSDPDSNALTYAWTVLDRPDGSTAQLTGATTVRPTFTPDKAGPYAFALQVTDSHGAKSQETRVELRAKDQNHTPSVRLTLNRAYSRQQPLLVERMGERELRNDSMNWTGKMDLWNGFSIASNAIDVDGDPLTHLWSITNEPAGNVAYLNSSANLCENGDVYTEAKGAAENLTPQAYYEEKLKLRNWTCGSISMAPSVPGDYTFTLSVYDGTERVGPYTVTVPAADRANYPGLLLESTNTATRWSNAQQAFVLAADTAHAQQQIFPFDLDAATSGGEQTSITTSGNSLADNFGTGDFVARTYILTAGNRDYTITGLKAVDTGGVYRPRFDGLADGQVIKKGEKVEFRLVLPIEKPLEVDGNGRPVNRKTFHWTFGVAENPAFTFSFKPQLFQY